jgi:hypothetical protein
MQILHPLLAGQQLRNTLNTVENSTGKCLSFTTKRVYIAAPVSMSA